ncbi:MAG: hypothetical protein KJO51_01710 [Gramella sp.]|nr:hypothetical protein [Christiangramia sp.]
MKRLEFVLAIMLVSLFLSCDKDMDDIDRSEAEVNALILIVQEGEWKITNYTFEGSDETANFSDYIFSFREENNLLASANSDEFIGTWRVSDDTGDEFDPFNDVDFNIFFNSSGKLGQLTNNYDVISATNSEIRLKLAANQEQQTATLTFSRN